MDQANKSNQVFLHPGEYIVATSTCAVHTLLGSCVSIVFWHPVRKIGAMSHSIIPTRGRKSEIPLSGRYVDETVLLMLHELERLGIDPSECRVGLYGGSNMLQLQIKPEDSSIGQKNGELAKRLLAKHGITISEVSLFGNGHRKIAFDIETGEVIVHHGESEIEFAQGMPGRASMYVA